tara:strand:+ start:127 stop:357 length:231 start_codon:yes stop_codon:yes gene_type:complete
MKRINCTALVAIALTTVAFTASATPAAAGCNSDRLTNPTANAACPQVLYQSTGETKTRPRSIDDSGRRHGKQGAGR